MYVHFTGNHIILEPINIEGWAFLFNIHDPCVYTGGVQIIGRNSRFFGYFVTKTKKNTEKNTRRFKVNSSSIRQYPFCLEIQSINWGNPAFFDPSFCCTFRSHRTLLSEAVFLWALTKPLHWYGTLLSEIQSFSYNSLSVNQKPACYFKSKYPVNMTDEEWLQVLEKKFQVLKFFTSPVRAYGRGNGGCTFSTVKCLLLVVIWQVFLCGFYFSCSWRDCIQISQIRVWSARNDATSDNWVLPIIKCPPVVCHILTMVEGTKSYALLADSSFQVEGNKLSTWASWQW